MTQNEKVLKALQSNYDGLTARQLEARYGLGSARAVIRNLRLNGIAIYSNPTGDGRVKYRIGTPSREIVAAGYRALGVA